MRSSAKLKEKFIQAVAIEILTVYYQKYSCNNKIYSAAEVRTKEKKRADGLIVWKSTQRKTNVASIEAKSYNTLRNLIAKPHQKKILRSSQQLSFILIIGTTMLVFGLGYRFVLEPLMILVLLISSIVLTVFIEKFLYKIQLNQHQKIDVIEQIRQYPANERWIAIGFDSYTKTEQLDNLLKKCKANGFGLLIVRDKKNAEMELIPRFENYPRTSDFLHFYQKETDIRKQIEGTSSFGFSQKSPSQRAYQSQKRGYIFLYLVLLMFCSFLYIRPMSPSSDLPIIENLPNLTLPPPIKTETPSQDSIIVELPKKTVPKEEIPLPTTTSSTIVCQQKIKGTKYIVKIDLYKTENAAQESARQLNKLNPGLKSDYFWLPCYKTTINQAVFCVYVYHPRSDKASMEHNLKKLKYIGKQAKVDFGQAEVWRIRSL